MSINQLYSKRMRTKNIIALVAAAKLGGCDQPITESIDMKRDIKPQECSSKSQLFYWPGYMIDNKGKPYDVTVQVLPSNLPSERTIFKSETEIPSEMRDHYRAEIQLGMDFTGFFFNSDSLPLIVKNNLFMPLAPEYEGRLAGQYGKGLGGVNVLSRGQDSLACCFDGCKEFDVTVLATGYGKALFHELLHDIWYTYLDGQKKNNFSVNSLLFFSLVGGNWQSDELLGGIFTGAIIDATDPSKLRRGDPNDLKNPIDDIDEWADGLKRKGISDIQVEHIKNAVNSYISIRTEVFFIRTHNFSVFDRDSYVVIEGFAFLGTNIYNNLDDYYTKGKLPQKKMLPRFLHDAYLGVLKPDKLEAFTIDSEYLSNRTDLIKFEPFLIDFINFTKQRHPWLNDIGK